MSLRQLFMGLDKSSQLDFEIKLDQKVFFFKSLTEELNVSPVN